jgi:hypothetical protein
MRAIAALRRTAKAIMKICPLSLLALLICAALPLAASAQTVATPSNSAATPAPATAAAPAASVPLRSPATQPAPRRQSARESSTNAVAPGKMRPERPVTPQISIPLGRTTPAPQPTPAPPPRAGNPTATGGVDDAAARCQAEEDATLRAECRDRLARAKTPK